MNPASLIWYVFAALAVAAGLMVALSKNVIHCGFGLLFALVGVTGMYAFLGADFLMATQVVVYVGGILVLVLFAVMMTHRVQAKELGDELVQPFAAAATALVVLALSMAMVLGTAWPVLEDVVIKPTTRDFGVAFLTTYLFPFEFASVLLLVAMMGAALIIRQQKKKGQDG